MEDILIELEDKYIVIASSNNGHGMLKEDDDDEEEPDMEEANEDLPF